MTRKRSTRHWHHNLVPQTKIMSRIVRLLLACTAFALPSGHRCNAGEKLTATDFVRVEQVDGVWWFVGPDGDRFVSLGVNHLEPHLWLAPYNKQATLDRYGADFVSADGTFDTHSDAAAKWIDRQVATCHKLGFNSFGKHTHSAIDAKLYQDDVYYIASLETAPLAGWQERRGRGPRPDVFSDEFAQHVEKRVADVCGQHKDQPNLLGYLYTDIPSWKLGKWEQKQRGDTVMIYPWVNAILPLGQWSAGKQRWVDLLESRHGSLDTAARVWGFEVSDAYGISRDELARLVDWTKPADVEAAHADMEAFMQQIVERWYSLHKALIHKYDTNHLILGDKNLIKSFHDWMLPSLKKHVDVIVVQAYGRWSDDVKQVAEIYAATGKPIVNGDGCYSFVGPGQKDWGIKGARTGAENLGEVMELYSETIDGMLATPFVIGWHHCGYLEQWDAAERGDSPMNENGFLDPFEAPKTAWTNLIRIKNSAANEVHRRAK